MLNKDSAKAIYNGKPLGVFTLQELLQAEQETLDRIGCLEDDLEVDNLKEFQVSIYNVNLKQEQEWLRLIREQITDRDLNGNKSIVGCGCRIT